MTCRIPRFTYNDCGSFTKSKECNFFFKKRQKCKIYLSKETTTVCFQHGMVYGDFKSLPRRTACDKVLRDKTFNIVKIQYIMEIKKALLQ